MLMKQKPCSKHIAYTVRFELILTENEEKRNFDK